MTPEDIIPEADVIRIHAHARFPEMTPRQVLEDGLLRYAVGRTCGHTQLQILLEHELVKQKTPSYTAEITAKGKEYIRAMHAFHVMLEASNPLNNRPSGVDAPTDPLWPENVISEEDIIRVHGSADFGPYSPRRIVNDGVLKYAIGYTGGSTQVAILRAHGLILKPRSSAYTSSLTSKGKTYLRSMFNDVHMLDVLAAMGRMTTVEADTSPADAAELR